GHGQSERMGGMIDIARRAARTNANGSVSRIYAHALHQRQINHQSVVAAAQAWAIVAASANGDKQPVLPTKIHRGYHIGDVDTLSNQPRPLIDHAVIEAAHFVIARIVRLDHCAAHGSHERFDSLAGHARFGPSRCQYHRMSPFVWCRNAPTLVPRATRRVYSSIETGIDLRVLFELLYLEDV